MSAANTLDTGRTANPMARARAAKTNFLKNGDELGHVFFSL